MKNNGTLMASPFAFLNCINSGKKDPSLNMRDYVPFLINRSLSYFPDCIGIVNEMNLQHHIDPEIQFSFLINMIRPRRRFTKWTKPGDQDDLKLVAEHYGYNMDKATQALGILSDDQLDVIRKIKSESESNDRRKQHGGNLPKKR